MSVASSGTAMRTVGGAVLAGVSFVVVENAGVGDRGVVAMAKSMGMNCSVPVQIRKSFIQYNINALLAVVSQA